MSSVVRPWVEKLTMMQQSVLFGSVRGPDGVAKYHRVKYLLRFYRRAILKSSFMGVEIDDPYKDDGGSFLGASIFWNDLVQQAIANQGEHALAAAIANLEASGGWEPPMDKLVDEYLAAVDELPHHFQLHFMHAVEIVGYKHPNPRVREWWAKVYLRLVHDFHLFPESEEQMDRRLGDSRDTWLERADRATVA